MLQYEEDQISFNLLALCRSPLCALSDELGRNIKMMRHLAQLARSDPRFKNAIPPEEEWLDEESLEAFRLSKSELDSLVIPEDFLERISKPSFGIVELVDLYQSLLTEQRRIKAEYRDEKLNMDDDERRVMSRKMDYSPAIHEWIKRLCEHGVLRQLVEETK